MKRSPLKRKTPLRRGGPLRRKSTTNSRVWKKESKPLRDEYERRNPRCEICGGQRVVGHHILRGKDRYDVWSNLMSLCQDCHRDWIHSHDGQVWCLHYKFRKGELDPDDFWFLPNGLSGKLELWGVRSSADVERKRQALLRRFSVDS